MALTVTRRLAALGLLAAQLLASGAVTLAHAREQVDAPRRVESAQHEHCPVLHNAKVCVLCSFSHNRAAAPVSSAAVVLPTTKHSPSPAGARPRAVRAPRTGDARAPPHSPG